MKSGMDPGFDRAYESDDFGLLTAEEEAEWAAVEEQMANCPNKTMHDLVDEGGCLNCGYGAP